MPYKIFTKNSKKDLKISTFVSVLRLFLKNGRSRYEIGAMPTQFAFIFLKGNEEALLKVSIKNFHWFQSCKTPLFQKLP